MTANNVNFNYLKEITDNDKEEMADFIRDVLQLKTQVVADLIKATGNENKSSIASQCHKMKSTIRIFGYEDTQKLLEKVERSCKQDHSIELIKKDVSEILSILENLESELNSEFKKIV